MTDTIESLRAALAAAEEAREKAELARARERIATLEGLCERARRDLLWCSGSADFQTNGYARRGWIKGPVETIAALSEAASAAPVERDPAPCMACDVLGADLARAREALRDTSHLMHRGWMHEAYSRIDAALSDGGAAPGEKFRCSCVHAPEQHSASGCGVLGCACDTPPTNV